MQIERCWKREEEYTGHLQDNEYHMTWRAIIKESFLFCQDEFYSLSNVEKVASSPFLTIIVINVLLGKITTLTV